MTDGADGLLPGTVAWAELSPAFGREQAGRRPVVVVASRRFLETVTTLAIIVPLTTVDRDWPNHVPVDHPDLGRGSWAMTEQPRTIARERIVGVIGVVDGTTLDRIRAWLDDFLTD